MTNLKFGMLATMEEMPVTVAEAQNIQAQLTALGIETEIEIVELGVLSIAGSPPTLTGC